MTDSFDPIEYLEYLRLRWKFLGTVVVSAVVVATLVAWLLPKRYTATAIIVIEPPNASDPRVATAVSPMYLESLKTYEDFASADTLFLKACDKFHLLSAPGSPTVESFKRRVLRVTKLKETKLLQISATLPDPRQAQALVEYLAEETVALSHATVSEQLRIVDPGIVPQQPSFPDVPLTAGAALLSSTILCLAYLSLQFGITRRSSRTVVRELKVAGGRGD